MLVAASAEETAAWTDRALQRQVLFQAASMAITRSLGGRLWWAHKRLLVAAACIGWVYAELMYRDELRKAPAR